MSLWIKQLCKTSRVMRTALHLPTSEIVAGPGPMRVSLHQGDSIIGQYFVKIAKGDLGMSMIRCEYESMVLLRQIIADSVVRPIAWGTCSSEPNHHFYVSKFHHLVDEPPDVSEFCRIAARLHILSANLLEQGKITQPMPGGRFGFHVTTHMGAFPQDNEWTDSWEHFFARGMRRILAYETDAQGRSEEFDSLAAGLLDRVIPRLLRPLETKGRIVRPVLVHGDFQIRNVKRDTETRQLILFDAGSFWDYNECELGKWSIARFGIGRQYIDEYHRLVLRSEPVDNWEDRNILYSIRFNLLPSAHYPDNNIPHQLALADMRYLVDKYADCYTEED
ncbi:Fructosamine kinase domain containing protein [Rhypophila sp. PSN 637]